MDEAGLRTQARRLSDGLAARHPDSEVLFASKSFPCLAAYQLFAAEGLSIDVAGAGELVMALAAGVPPERMYLHGNAKTTAELTMALDAGVATVVVDNFDDIDRLEQLATRPQRVLIRIIPGVAPETHESQSTGGDDSKFGLPLDQAREAIARIRASGKLQLDGLHLHIGSQILDTEPFARAVEAVSVLGDFPVYDVGGGLGVRYTLEDEAPSVEEYLDTIAARRPHLPAGRRQAADRARPVPGGPLLRHALPGDHGQAHRPHVRRGGRRHGRQPRRGAHRPGLRGGPRHPDDGRARRDNPARRPPVRVG